MKKVSFICCTSSWCSPLFRGYLLFKCLKENDWFSCSSSYKHSVCRSQSLGMEDSTIPDDAIKSWSPILGKFQPAEARLNGPFAWCTAENLAPQNGPFLQITLDKPYKIAGIATKSFHNFWITEYLVMYKVGRSFTLYKETPSHAGVSLFLYYLFSRRYRNLCGIV